MPETIALPVPEITGGRALLDARGIRRSTREYSHEPLPPQELSNILWAACGHSREPADTGIFVECCRTSPTVQLEPKQLVTLHQLVGYSQHDLPRPELAAAAHSHP